MIVKSLKLRAKQDQHQAGRYHLEEALRSTPQPDEKLIIVRKIDFGKLDFARQNLRLSGHVHERLTEKYSSAVHASQALSGAADVIWFRSVAEARLIFLRMILSGQRPRAWFWSMAMPDWQDGDCTAWLDRQISSAFGDVRQTITLGREILQVSKYASGVNIARVFKKLPTATVEKYCSANDSSQDASSSVDANWHKGESNPPSAIAAAEVRVLANQLLGNQNISHIMAAISGRQNRPIVATLVVLLLAAIRPDLVNILIQKPHLANEIAALIEADGEQLHMPGHSDAQVRPIHGDAHVSGHTNPSTGPPKVQESTKTNDIETHKAYNQTDKIVAEPIADIAHEYFDISDEQLVSNAGLLLIIPALNRLGLHKWLEDRSDHFNFNFAAHLIAYLAAKYGHKRSHHIFDILELEEQAAEDILAINQDDFRLWGAIADKWLRKKARRRIHDLSLRRGWISSDAEKLDIRYPEAAADIRLRRLALDVNPGWVSWLGRSVHYHFSDHALDGDLAVTRKAAL